MTGEHGRFKAAIAFTIVGTILIALVFGADIVKYFSGSQSDQVFGVGVIVNYADGTSKELRSSNFPFLTIWESNKHVSSFQVNALVQSNFSGATPAVCAASGTLITSFDGADKLTLDFTETAMLTSNVVAKVPITTLAEATVMSWVNPFSTATHVLEWRIINGHNDITFPDNSNYIADYDVFRVFTYITSAGTEPPPQTYILTVASTPVTGVAVTVDGAAYTTNAPINLTVGWHTVGVAVSKTVSGTTYNFGYWQDDGTTSTSRSVDLENSRTITAVYTPATIYAGWLHTSGTHILSSDNQEVIWNGITTRGILGFWYYPYEELVHAADVPIIRSHGLNYIRVGISLDMALRGVAPSSVTPTHITYDPRFWTVLDSIVDACAQNGVWANLAFGVSDGCWANRGGAWSNNGNLGDGNGFPYWMYDGSVPWSQYLTKTYPNTLQGKSDAISDFFAFDDSTAANIRLVYQTFWMDIADRYKDRGYVIFSLFNEPLNVGGGPDIFAGSMTEARMVADYRAFMEDTIDKVRTKDGGTHFVIINEAYFYSYSTNPKVDRPNVAVENHAYWKTLTPASSLQEYAQLAWRYNQPFILGEFGGVESDYGGSLQTIDQADATMKACNSLNVGWLYLDYRPSPPASVAHPSAAMWAKIDADIRSDIKYPHP